ncbi:MAG: hypothetical protein ACRCS9_09250 [Hyphomicrobium sp.]
MPEGSVLLPILIVAALIIATVAVIAFVIAPRVFPADVHFGTDPDAPRAFGYAMAWLAIKSTDTDAVLKALQIEDARPSNWTSGVGAIYDAELADTHVFIAPPVKGWTLVAGVPLPLPVGRRFVDKLTPLLASLSREFNDVQYYAAYPIIDLFAWARWRNAVPMRAFAIGDDGMIWDRGRLTPDERALGLSFYELRGIKGRKGDAGGAIILHPTEQQVMRVAQAWSLDPARLNVAGGSVSAGWIAKAPSSWRAERQRTEKAA